MVGAIGAGRRDEACIPNDRDRRVVRSRNRAIRRAPRRRDRNARGLVVERPPAGAGSGCMPRGCGGGFGVPSHASSTRTSDASSTRPARPHGRRGDAQPSQPRERLALGRDLPRSAAPSRALSTARSTAPRWRVRADALARRGDGRDEETGEGGGRAPPSLAYAAALSAFGRSGRAGPGRHRARRAGSPPASARPSPSGRRRAPRPRSPARTPPTRPRRPRGRRTGDGAPAISLDCSRRSFGGEGSDRRPRAAPPPSRSSPARKPPRRAGASLGPGSGAERRTR